MRPRFKPGTQTSEHKTQPVHLKLYAFFLVFFFFSANFDTADKSPVAQSVMCHHSKLDPTKDPKGQTEAPTRSLSVATYKHPRHVPRLQEQVKSMANSCIQTTLDITKWGLGHIY